MNEFFIVYNGKPYSAYLSVEGGFILLSSDEACLKEGYVPYEEPQVARFKKFIPYSEVTHQYKVYDRALYEGWEYEIKRSNEINNDYLAPDAYVQLIVNKEFLSETPWTDGAYVMEEKYGEKIYVSGKIPISEVTILRRRKNYPIE